MGMYTCEAYAELYVHLWSPRRGTAGPSSFLTEWLNGVSKLQKWASDSCLKCEVGMLLAQKAAEMPAISRFMGRG